MTQGGKRKCWECDGTGKLLVYKGTDGKLYVAGEDFKHDHFWVDCPYCK